MKTIFPLRTNAGETVLTTYNVMKVTLKLVLLVLAALSSTTAINAQALLTGPYGGSTLFLDTVGYSFTVGSNALSASKLGVADTAGTGLPLVTKVGLWNNNGDLLASKSLPAGTSATLSNYFRWIDLDSPITLDAHTTYRIGAQASNDAWFSGYLPGYGGKPVWHRYFDRRHVQRFGQKQHDEFIQLSKLCTVGRHCRCRAKSLL